MTAPGLSIMTTALLEPLEHLLDDSPLLECQSQAAHECTHVARWICHCCKYDRFWCESRYKLWTRLKGTWDCALCHQSQQHWKVVAL